MNVHLDEFTLLRYTAQDLSGDELGSAARHLEDCRRCGSTLSSLRSLDGELRSLAAAGAMTDAGETPFPPDDPFRERPRRRLGARVPGGVARAEIEASESGLALQGVILDAAKSGESLAAAFSNLDPARVGHRFAVLYALQESGRRSAESPFDAMKLAEATRKWLRRPAPRAVEAGLERAEAIVPRLILRAQANVLLGIGRLWTKDYGKAREHFIVAYRSFGRAGGDLTNLALVELGEAQRRGLAGEGASALALARRARETFEAAGVEDYAARAMVAEGLALDQLDRREEAVAACRRALPLFERFGLWSNYVGSLNCAATFLIKLGRVDEARREFARALRRFSQQQHKYWLGYIRIGLAETLFAARHFPEAAVAASRAARVFAECALRAHGLIAMLLEVECWARTGSLARARRRLDVFWTEIERDRTLDPFVVRELAGALSGADPNYERLSTLRGQISELIQERYRAV